MPTKKPRTAARRKTPAKRAPAAPPSKPPTRKILLVDDDAVILSIYGKNLTRAGFEVATAADGSAALEMLQAARPDLVVLDMMMPKLTGVDVLKFIRSHPDLRQVPVAIFTNAFLDDLAQEAIEIGVQRTVVKADCTPAKLAAIANELLDPSPVAAGASEPGAAPAPGSAPFPDVKMEAVEAEASAAARRDFLKDAPATIAALRELYQAFRKSPDPAARAARLDAFYRKVHFVTAIAGLACLQDLALLSGVFEVLLFELQRTPGLINPSSLRTIALTLDFLGVLLARAGEASTESPPAARVMVVDDDAVTNRSAVLALRRAHLDADAVEDPLLALERLREARYDLVLVDIEMPGMNGFELCRKLRALPNYERTPVIYVTVHTDFESRAQGVLSGGSDLIPKPFLPIELAVKAVMHLTKSRLPASPREGQVTVQAG